MGRFNQSEFVLLLEEVVRVSPTLISVHKVTSILYRREWRDRGEGKTCGWRLRG